MKRRSSPAFASPSGRVSPPATCAQVYPEASGSERTGSGAAVGGTGLAGGAGSVGGGSGATVGGSVAGGAVGGAGVAARVSSEQAIPVASRRSERGRGMGGLLAKNAYNCTARLLERTHRAGAFPKGADDV